MGRGTLLLKRFELCLLTSLSTAGTSIEMIWLCCHYNQVSLESKILFKFIEGAFSEKKLSEEEEHDWDLKFTIPLQRVKKSYKVFCSSGGDLSNLIK